MSDAPPGVLIADQHEMQHVVSKDAQQDIKKWTVIRDWLEKEAKKGDMRAAVTLIAYAEPSCKSIFESWIPIGAQWTTFGYTGLVRIGEELCKELGESLAEAGLIAGSIGYDELKKHKSKDAFFAIMAACDNSFMSSRISAFKDLCEILDIPEHELHPPYPLGNIIFRMKVEEEFIWKPTLETAKLKLIEIFNGASYYEVFPPIPPDIYMEVFEQYAWIEKIRNKKESWDLSKLEELHLPALEFYQNAALFHTSIWNDRNAIEAIPLLRPEGGLDLLESKKKTYLPFYRELVVLLDKAIKKWHK